MDRCTYFGNGAWRIYLGMPVVDRLAAYENTGLEPEEIMALCAMDKRAKMAEALRKEENALLTLEELREMDGEPVWVVQDGYVSRWHLVDVSWRAKNVIYLYAAHGPVLLAEAAIANGAKIYRRKPEEGT